MKCSNPITLIWCHPWLHPKKYVESLIHHGFVARCLIEGLRLNEAMGIIFLTNLLGQIH